MLLLYNNHLRTCPPDAAPIRSLTSPVMSSYLYVGGRISSLAVDPHKWLYMPIDSVEALVRDKQTMRDTVSLVHTYLRDETAEARFSELRVQQSRRLRELKLWMT